MFLREGDIRPPWNLLRQYVVAVIGPSVPWNAYYTQVYNLVRRFPAGTLFTSRNIRGVDHMTKLACEQLKQDYREMIPPFDLPRWDDRAGRARWFAVRNMLIPIYANELHVFHGKMPDSWIGKIVRSARQRPTKLVEYGADTQLSLFAPAENAKLKRRQTHYSD